MYISLRSHHSPKIEAMASVIGVMEIKHQRVRTIPIEVQNQWTMLMSWLVQHQLLWRLNERDFMVPGGNEGKTLAIANTAIEQVKQANLLWALVFLPNSLLCVLSSTEVDLM